MEASQTEAIGTLIASVVLAVLLIVRMFFDSMKERYSQWREQRAAKRQAALEMAERVERIEESTVNSHPTNLRDDVDAVNAKLEQTVAIVHTNSCMLEAATKKIDFIAAAVQDLSDRQSNEERDRQALGEQARRDHDRYDHEFRKLSSRMDRLDGKEP